MTATGVQYIICSSLILTIWLQIGIKLATMFFSLFFEFQQIAMIHSIHVYMHVHVGYKAKVCTTKL